MHILQDKGTISVEAMQTLRVGVRHNLYRLLWDEMLTPDPSGDKKTKGAALVF